MMLLGTAVNCITVIIGSLLGLLFKNGLLKKYSDGVMKCVGLCTFFIGVSGMLSNTVTNVSGETVTIKINMIIVILSIVIGFIIGEVLKLDKRVDSIGEKIEAKLPKKDDGLSLSSGFINASLLFCVGSMSIIGPLQSGLIGDHSIQYSKALLDFISATIFASSFGIGVIFSAITILLYQGIITVLASFIVPILSPEIIGHICCVGSITIVALSFNLLGITKLKIMNFIPSLVLPAIIIPIINLF